MKFKTLRFKLAGLVILSIISILAVLVVACMALMDLERRFTDIRVKALDGQIASISITRDMNYVSRLTRNIMLGSDIEKDLAKLDKRIDRIRKNFTILADSAANPAEAQRIAKAKTAALSFVEDGRRFAKSLGDLPKEQRYLKYTAYGQSATPLAQESRKYFGELVKQKDAFYTEAVHGFSLAIKQTLYTDISLAVAVMVAVLLLSIFILRSILRSLRTATQYTIAIAQGEYEQTVDAKSLDAEIGVMVEALQAMGVSLQKSMEDVQEQAQNAQEQADSATEAKAQADRERERVLALLDGMSRVTADASTIAKQINNELDGLGLQMQDMNTGAVNQRDRTQETATAMEEMNATVAEVAATVAHTASEADSARTQALEGAEIVNGVIEATGVVNKQVEAMRTAFDSLGVRVDEIGSILAVITDIADQTNLLALNAAIEAARAGDAGRGFAVVADEVRKLAEKTMEATKSVAESISSIQSGANMNITAIGEVGKALEKTTLLTDSAGEALNQIVEISINTAGRVQSIAAATDQQAAASEEITNTTNQVNSVAEEISGRISNSVAALDNVAHLVSDLEKLMKDLEQYSTND